MQRLPAENTKVTTPASARYRLQNGADGQSGVSRQFERHGYRDYRAATVTNFTTQHG